MSFIFKISSFFSFTFEPKILQSFFLHSYQHGFVTTPKRPVCRLNWSAHLVTINSPKETSFIHEYPGYRPIKAASHSIAVSMEKNESTHWKFFESTMYYLIHLHQVRKRSVIWYCQTTVLYKLPSVVCLLVLHWLSFVHTKLKNLKI